MAQTPHRLQPDTPLADNLAYINDNFDKAVSDINDLGSRFSSVGSASVTLAAGDSLSLSVGVTDNHPIYKPGSLQIVPRAEAFIDNNGDDTYLLGYGSNLTPDQKLSYMSTFVARRPNTGYVAQFVVNIFNFGSSSHTYYLSVDESYIQSPQTGLFR